VKYTEIVPRGPARQFVERYWILETDGRDPQTQRIVPDGRPELIVNLGRPFESFSEGRWQVQPESFFVGQITAPLLVRPSGAARILGVRFRPQGAAQAFRIPMHELADTVTPLANLSVCFDPERGFAAIEQALARRSAQPDPLIDEAVRLATGGTWDVAQLAVRLGVSRRHLERRFREKVGITPKLFCRIQRFQRVFRVMEEGGGWAQAAVECGYYDQAHLVRDFREFAGEPPAALLNGDDLARHFLAADGRR
jgi:AraC-like DNA-binding protein